MSRYATEWARRQQVPDPTAKLVLFLLGDRAEGCNHVGTYYPHDLADQAGVTVTELDAILAGLKADELVADRQGGVFGYGVGFRLAIPFDWRVPRNQIRRPKNEAVGDDRPTAVYRLYDEGGRLLYVGISDQAEERLMQHAVQKHWYREVATREIVWFDTRQLADAEEDGAIAAEDPVYNLCGDIQDPVRRIREKGVKRRYVVTGGRYAIFQATVKRLRDDIRAGEFNSGPLPDFADLADRYGVDVVTAHQAVHRLHRQGALSVLDDGSFVREWGRP